MSELTTGDTLPALERYEVVREIGRGGMAVVYLARQWDLDRDVALKELRLVGAPDPSAALRFVRESRVAAALTHPNVVTVHDYFEQDGTPYIAMEHLPRGSLRPYVGRTSPAETVGVLEGLLAGLDRAGRSGVVHRDIKPENLMVTADGHVKIADFGIAKADRRLDHGSRLTMRGVPVGTPSYMAPEQAVGGELGPWTDLYSVGVVAWELFVGHLPFRDTPSAVGVLVRNVKDEIPSAHGVEPTVDPAISAWIDRLLAKEARERPRSASEAWDALEEIATRALGPGWRREARLRDRTGSSGVEPPLTPAPFTECGEGGACVAGRRMLVAAETPAPGRSASPAPTPVHDARPGPATAERPDVGPSAARAWTAAVAAIARRRPTVVAVLVAIAAIAAGWIAGGAGGDAASRRAVLEGAGLRVAVPAAWAHPRSVPRIPGLGRAGAVIAGPDRSGRTGVVADLVAYDPPSLLARNMRVAVQGGAPAPTAVQLGSGVPAYRYDRLRLAGYPGVVTIYAIPTTDWVATLACFAPPGRSQGFAPACAAVAATLRPTTSGPVPVGPSPAFGGRVARALAELRTAAAAPRRAFGRAASAADQAKAARRLARAYGHAADVLDELPNRVVDGTAIAVLAGGVRAAADAYGQLATAARVGAPADYDRARRELSAARTDLRKARGTLARGGYQTR